MVVENTTSRVDYTGNGVTVAFDFDFKVFAQGDIEVYVDGVLQTITTDYTVTLNTSTEGGTVTFVTAPANAKGVIIKRALDLTQANRLPIEGNLPETVIEQTSDKNTMLIQQLNDLIGRCLQFANDIDLTSVSTEIPALVAGNLLGVNATATGLQLYTTASISNILLPTPTLGYIATGDGTDNFVFQELGALIDAQTATAPALGDKLVSSDVSDSGNAKENTIQQILNLLGVVKGSIVIGNGTNIAAVAVGSNGYRLEADSTQATGVKWAKQTYVSWCRFDGTGTASITDSENTDSLDDEGTGQFAANWDVDYSDGNYATVGSCNNQSSGTAHSNSTTMVRAFTVDAGKSRLTHQNSTANTYYDPDNASIVAYGDR